MEHARDAEEAEEGIERVGRCRRPAREVVVEAFGVVAGDLVVLTAVVEEHLAAPGAEPAEAVGPGADVGGVEGLGFGGVVDVEGGRVPGGVVNDVFEPALKGGGMLARVPENLFWDVRYLGVAEWLSGVQVLGGQDFTARLHRGVDEVPILPVKGVEYLPDHFHLG